MQIPHDFFVRECEVLGFSLPPAGEYGVGMIFAHRYESFRKKQMETFEKIVREEGQSILGWREVPIDESIIGEAAKSIRPRIILSASCTLSARWRKRKSFPRVR